MDKKKLRHTPAPWMVHIFRKNPDISPTPKEMKTMLCEGVDKTVAHKDSIKDFFMVLSDDNPENPIYTAIVGNGKTSEANSHLISQAPDMLKALIKSYNLVLGYCMKVCGVNNYQCRYIDKCEIDKYKLETVNIIEKATGMSIDEVLKCKI